MSTNERSVNLIKDIANSINRQIQVTIDTQERDIETRLPVLNMKVWSNGKNILHTFYKKPHSSDKSDKNRHFICQLNAE